MAMDEGVVGHMQCTLVTTSNITNKKAFQSKAYPIGPGTEKKPCTFLLLII